MVKTLIYLDGKPLTQESQTIKSKRFAFVVKDNYEVDLEYNEDFAIIHLPFIKKLTKEVYLDMRNQMDKIVEFLNNVGYEHVWVAYRPEDTLIAKLADRMGFVYKGTADSLAVYLYEGSN